MTDTAPTPPAHYAHDLPFGAACLGPDRTRFRLWAPDAVEVWVDIDQGEAVRMAAEPDGWHAAVVPVGAGTCYRYRVTNRAGATLAVPDPAARAQWQDVHGPSLVVDPLRHAWQHPGWMGRPWHETVLYELHVGALGGFDAVRARLPELARLGITAVELMPVAEFPGARNWGYDGVLPFAPEAGYGPPDALKALIDTAHGLGLMVFLDVVYNHFGPDGNYLHHYARRFFRDDVQTPWGAAIDFRQPEVRAFFIENALMWLMEYRFDGLRLDAVHAIGARDWLVELAGRVRQRGTARRIAGQQPCTLHRRERHGGQPLRVVLQPMLRVRIGPRPVEHVFAVRVALHIERHGRGQDCLPGVARGVFPQGQVLGRPAGLGRGAAAGVQCMQEIEAQERRGAGLPCEQIVPRGASDLAQIGHQPRAIMPRSGAGFGLGSERAGGHPADSNSCPGRRARLRHRPQ